ncbi:MAG: DUF177 domain-containing protein [Burkholderiales bacterium]|nr:DUF177 domain-containing protein [Burkholderiales bacterium]
MTSSIQDIDVFALCKEHASVQGQLPLSTLSRLHGDLIHTTDAVSYHVSGSVDDEHRYLLHLSITGTLPMNCQRCAEELSHPLLVDNTLQLVHTEAELNDEEEELNAIMSGKAEIEKIVGSKNYDLLNLLEDEIILSLPIVIAHEVCEQTLPTSVGEKVSPFDALMTLKNK